jgi:hypothetical protein
MVKLSFLNDLDNEDDESKDSGEITPSIFKSRKLKRNLSDANKKSTSTRVGLSFAEEESDADISIILNTRSKIVSDKSNGKTKLIPSSKADTDEFYDRTITTIDNNNNHHKHVGIKNIKDYLKIYEQPSTITIEKNEVSTDIIDNSHAEGIILEGSDVEDSDIEQLNEEKSIISDELLSSAEMTSRRKEIEEALKNTNLDKDDVDMDEEVKSTIKSEIFQDIIEIPSLEKFENSVSPHVKLCFQPVKPFSEQMEIFKAQISSLSNVVSKQHLEMTHLTAEQEKIILKRQRYVQEMSQALHQCR